MSVSVKACTSMICTVRIVAFGTDLWDRDFCLVDIVVSSLTLRAFRTGCRLFYAFNNPGVGSDHASVDGEMTAAPTASQLNVTEPDQGLNASTSAPTSVGNYTTQAVNSQSVVAQPPQPSSAGGDATYSWWIIFLLVRQVMTFGLARGVQFLIVALSLRVNGGYLVGPLCKLFILQARGIPLQLVVWVLLDFALLFGDGRFPNHWLYYQDFLGVFNEDNPSGDVTGSNRYRGILIFALCTGLAVAAKRFFIGLRFGKASYHRYAERLSVILKQMVDIITVARFGSHEQIVTSSLLEQTGCVSRLLSDADGTNRGIISDDDDDDDDDSSDKYAIPMLIRPNTTGRTMTDSIKVKINELLGDWEEPDLIETTLEDPSLSSLVQFRASVGVLDSDYPFSPAFGCAKTRVEVVECAQRLYFDLMKIQKGITSEHHQGPVLKFHTIALSAVQRRGIFDRQEVKDLLKVFRPARNGDITLLDFCKSIDCVYKEMRKLRANIANEGRMNAATERILNVVFYFLLICIGLAVVGVDPFTFFGACSAFLISFSFMIKQCSSNYFRGLLFVLVQRPYDIGDRINVGKIVTAAATGGSPGWIVKDVTL